jgi:hypothetical protein
MAPEQALNTPSCCTAPGFPQAYHQANYFNYSTEIMRCWNLLHSEKNSTCGTVRWGGKVMSRRAGVVNREKFTVKYKKLNVKKSFVTGYNPPL